MVTRTPDNLRSHDAFEAYIGISEGPIEGLNPSQGLKRVYFGETPLLNQNGTFNFHDVYLKLTQGVSRQQILQNPSANQLRARLRGITDVANFPVNVSLFYDVPVVRTTNFLKVADWKARIQVRLVINRLLHQNNNGNFHHSGFIVLQYKNSSRNLLEKCFCNKL